MPSWLRELAEETGVQVGAEQLHALGYTRPDTGLLAARVALFWAECGDIGAQVRHDEEAQAIVTLPRATLLEHVRDGRIEDGFTSACVARWIVDAPERLLAAEPEAGARRQAR